MDYENINSEIKRIKSYFLAKLQKNTKENMIFSYKDYGKYFNVEIYTLKILVKELINDGYPIISTKKNDKIGLIICDNDEEFNSYCKNIEYKAKRMLDKLELIKRNYNNKTIGETDAN